MRPRPPAGVGLRAATLVTPGPASSQGMTKGNQSGPSARDGVRTAASRNRPRGSQRRLVRIAKPPCQASQIARSYGVLPKPARDPAADCLAPLASLWERGQGRKRACTTEEKPGAAARRLQGKSGRLSLLFPRGTGYSNKLPL